MAILLACNITTESPSKSPSRILPYSATPVPSPPRPLSPLPSPPLLPPTSSEAVMIPLPRGRKITHAPAGDSLDTETRFNTEFNTRRSAATSSASTAATSSKARNGKKVGFKRELVTFIPPPCLDLVLYRQRCDDNECAGKRMGRQWQRRRRRWLEWVLALVLAAVLAVGLVECGWWGVKMAAPVVLGQGSSGWTHIYTNT